MSVDPPTDLAYGSEVSVVVDEGGFLDMEGHETGLKFRPLVPKMCMLVYTDSALQNADAGATGGKTGIRRIFSMGRCQREMATSTCATEHVHSAPHRVRSCTQRFFLNTAFHGSRLHRIQTFKCVA